VCVRASALTTHIQRRAYLTQPAAAAATARLQQQQQQQLDRGTDADVYSCRYDRDAAAAALTERPSFCSGPSSCNRLHRVSIPRFSL